MIKVLAPGEARGEAAPRALVTAKCLSSVCWNTGKHQQQENAFFDFILVSTHIGPCLVVLSNPTCLHLQEPNFSYY